MEIFVNGKKVDFTLENEKYFGEVFDGLREWVSKGKKRIWSLQIDQVYYDPANQEAFRTLPIDGIQNVDLSVGEEDAGQELQNRAQGLLEGLKEAQRLIEQIATDFQAGNEKKVNETWPQLMNILKIFNASYPFLAAIHPAEKQEGFRKRYEKFKAKLEEIMQSIELEDNVSLCDQLVYELKPQLLEWVAFLRATRVKLKGGQ